MKKFGGQLAEQTLRIPPEPDELEISVFGAGVGECILVHCGSGYWICVDSAVEDGKCWALSYLDQIGVPADALKFLIATHWHTDHVLGLAELVGRAPNAQFVCSSALDSQEYKQIVARFSTDDVDRIRAPLREMKKVFQILATRKKNNTSYQPPIFTIADYPLHDASASIQIWTLSPSHQDRLNAMEAFAEYFVPVNASATGLSPIDRNHASVVVLIHVDPDVILLGADLERTPDSLTGWNAVVSSGKRLQKQSGIFKIPHHGSVNGHSEDVCTEMLKQDTIAIVTPYTRSGLPTSGDVDRMRRFTTYATGLPLHVRIRRDPAAEKIIQEVTGGLEARRFPQKGIVRLRKKVGLAAAWNTELFGSAVAL